MFVKIFGWFWIITGVMFLIWPHFLRNRIQKKSLKIVRRYLFAAMLFVGAFLITTGLKLEGMASKIILVVGVITLIKGFLFLKAKAAEGIIQFLLKQPLLFFRIWALVQTGSGLLLINIQNLKI